MDIIRMVAAPLGTPPAPVALTVLVLLMGLDVVTGVLAAKLRDDVSSTAMRKGAYHKSGELGFVMVGSMLDTMVEAGMPQMGVTSPITVAVLAYLIIAEAISVMENCVKLNPDLGDSPAFRVLRSVTDKALGEKGEDDD